MGRGEGRRGGHGLTVAAAHRRRVVAKVRGVGGTDLGFGDAKQWLGQRLR